MKKQTKIIILIIILAIIAVAGIIFIQSKKNKTNLEPVNNNEDLVGLIEKIYENQENILPRLSTQTIDINDENMVKSYTGLENGEKLEYLAVSEPMISSQAYSLVLAKVKSGVNANEIAKEMSENINPAKWICVSAEKIYSTSSGDIVCLIMSSEEWAKPIYEKFKTLSGNVGQEYEKTVNENLEGMETQEIIAY